MNVSYRNLQEEIRVGLREAITNLKAIGYESQPIAPREFYDYMTGETPTGDTINIVDVLDNEFLMIHEVVEINELKKIGIAINSQTVRMTYPNVYEPHYTATEYELKYAIGSQAYDWLRVRITHVTSWLEDPNMPQHLIPRCKAIVKKVSEALESSS